MAVGWDRLNRHFRRPYIEELLETGKLRDI
jgi:hypothetical protein